MAAEATGATGRDAVKPRRHRGKNKAPAWVRPDEVAVIELPLVVTDPCDLARVDKLYGAMWQVKRALQRDARAKVDAYWAAKRERDRDGGKAVWQRLGLTREGLERSAYKHLEHSRHLKHHVSKALVMHIADEVWNGVDRHLFGDASGRRLGRPRVGRWWDFTRIPGRARSHTKANKWETFRLVGTLQGHLDVHTKGGRLAQPHRMPQPALPDGKTVPTGKTPASGKPGMRKATWWDHNGPLAVVFTGGPDSTEGDLVLPVRLPGAGTAGTTGALPGRPRRVAQGRPGPPPGLLRAGRVGPGSPPDDPRLRLLLARRPPDARTRSRAGPAGRGGRQRLQPVDRVLPRQHGPRRRRPGIDPAHPRR
ncbi:hypothetical protein [Actinomadura sp. 6N118]|uniref:hypothetical protein n=1 Tax=Actinomadura sp. 6N118 TaxID=3375151 RepID=UPI0037A55B29